MGWEALKNLAAEARGDEKDPRKAAMEGKVGWVGDHPPANIQAVIRLRPAKKHEETYVACNPRVGNQLVLKDLDYTDRFTSVLGASSSQAEAFRVCGLPLVEATLQGRRTCLFAYGQTGSGKTFSMYGAEGGKNPSKLDGLVPGICAELFRRKQELEKRKDFQLVFESTLVEVQGNKVIDLLAEELPTGDQPQLKVIGDRWRCRCPAFGEAVVLMVSETSFADVRACTRQGDGCMDRKGPL